MKEHNDIEKEENMVDLGKGVKADKDLLKWIGKAFIVGFAFLIIYLVQKGSSALVNWLK